MDTIDHFCCEICGQGVRQGITVYRNNKKGERAVWRCEFHLDKRPDETTRIIPDILEKYENTTH